MAVRAPAARAAVSAAFVAVVAPSCEIPMTSPLDGGSWASSNAWAAVTSWCAEWPGARTSDDRTASRTISATAKAACSDVPHPVTVTGVPLRMARRTAVARSAAALRRPAWLAMIRAASAGSAAIISVMWNGGPSRCDGISVEAQGSGAPGRGAVGSKSVVAFIGAG